MWVSFQTTLTNNTNIPGHKLMVSKIQQFTLGSLTRGNPKHEFKYFLTNLLNLKNHIH